MATGVGGVLDGALRQYGAYDQEGLVHVPKNLDWLEAATLGCAGLTAWNAFYGLQGRLLRQGDWVVTQGTGGVSVFALQVFEPLLLPLRGQRLKLRLVRQGGWCECYRDDLVPGKGEEA